MLRLAVVFFVMSLVAIIFGSSGLAGVSMELGRLLLFLFLATSGIFLVGSIFVGKNSNKLL